MIWQPNPFTLLLAIAVIAAVVWASVMWRRTRRWPPGQISIMLVLTSAAWSAVDALQLSSADPGWMLFWFRVSVLIAVWVSAQWFVLALALTGQLPLLAKRRWLILGLVPVTISILTMLDSRMHLILSEVSFMPADGILAMSYRYGPALAVFSVYAYVLQLVAAGFFIRVAVRAHQVHWRQITTILIGWSVTAVLFLLDLSDQMPVTRPRLLPLSVIIAFPIFVAFFDQIRRADFAPLARATLIDVLPDPVVIIDSYGGVLDLNHQAEKLFGVTVAQALGNPLKTIDQNLAAFVSAQPTRHGSGERTEPPSVTEYAQGKAIFDLRQAPMTDWRRRTIGSVIVLRDISERKQIEDFTRRALHEKDMLLREIHHRVKNNLQIVSSLLSLQAGTLGDPALTEKFQDSQDRIRSMALIHERLYRSDDLALIDFGIYLRELTDSLVRTYGRHAQQVQLQVNADSVLLDVDHAIPCGLIVNELVSNALKHAFPDGRAGTLRILLRLDGQRGGTPCYALTVQDDGIGIPADMLARDRVTLGLQLVESLVRQLEGTLTVDSAAGTRFEIRWGREPAPTPQSGAA